MYFAMNMPHYLIRASEVAGSIISRTRDLYAAFVSTLDERVQRLVKYLEDSGLRDNTIIIYQSDERAFRRERALWRCGSQTIAAENSACSKVAFRCFTC